MTIKPEPLLYLSERRGHYIPRDFAADTKRECIAGVSADDLDYLAAGPDGEHYWDVWTKVEDNATVTDPQSGTVYTLYQNGDLWLVPVGMDWSEELEFFVWPSDSEEGEAP